jgi:hypothetical protein
MKPRNRAIIANQGIKAKNELLIAKMREKEKEANEFKPTKMVGYSVDWKKSFSNGI